jgi:hypothetical protein
MILVDRPLGSEGCVAHLVYLPQLASRRLALRGLQVIGHRMYLKKQGGLMVLRNMPQGIAISESAH